MADLVPGDCWAAPAVADSVADYWVAAATVDPRALAAARFLVDSQARSAVADWARDDCLVSAGPVVGDSARHYSVELRSAVRYLVERYLADLAGH